MLAILLGDFPGWFLKKVPQGPSNAARVSVPAPLQT
jgi:hypothetical protein